MKNDNIIFWILFHIVIYSTEIDEFVVSCFADINNIVIKGKFIVNFFLWLLCFSVMPLSGQTAYFFDVKQHEVILSWFQHHILVIKPMR